MASDYPINHMRSRFHTCCDHCHFIDAHKTRSKALASARDHFHGPETCVFDSMARPGMAQTITWDGSRTRFAYRADDARSALSRVEQPQ